MKKLILTGALFLIMSANLKAMEQESIFSPGGAFDKYKAFNNTMKQAEYLSFQASISDIYSLFNKAKLQKMLDTVISNMESLENKIKEQNLNEALSPIKKILAHNHGDLLLDEDVQESISEQLSNPEDLYLLALTLKAMENIIYRDINEFHKFTQSDLTLEEFKDKILIGFLLTLNDLVKNDEIKKIIESKLK